MGCISCQEECELFEKLFVEMRQGAALSNFRSRGAENTIPSMCTQVFPPAIALYVRKNAKMFSKSQQASRVKSGNRALECR
jgi:hypothetical protein